MNQKEKMIVGGVVIGIVELFGGLLGTIICAVFLGNSELRLKHLNYSYYGEYMVHLLLVFYLLVSIIQTLVSSILIGGILKESTKALFAWMTIKCIFFGLLIIAIIWRVVERNFAPAAFYGLLFVVNFLYVLFIRMLRLKLLPDPTSSVTYNKIH